MFGYEHELRIISKNNGKQLIKCKPNVYTLKTIYVKNI